MESLLFSLMLKYCRIIGVRSFAMQFHLLGWEDQGAVKKLKPPNDYLGGFGPSFFL